MIDNNFNSSSCFKNCRYISIAKHKKHKKFVRETGSRELLFFIGEIDDTS